MNLENCFGEVLRRRRIQKGFSQEKLSELCGLDRTFISLLERGKRMPTLGTLFKIAESLKANPSKLVKEIEEEMKKYQKE